MAQHDHDHDHDHDAPLGRQRELDRKDSLAVIRAAIHRNAARQRENSDINALVSDFGYLYAWPNAKSARFTRMATQATNASAALSMQQRGILSPRPPT